MEQTTTNEVCCEKGCKNEASFAYKLKDGDWKYTCRVHQGVVGNAVQFYEFNEYLKRRKRKTL